MKKNVIFCNDDLKFKEPSTLDYDKYLENYIINQIHKAHKKCYGLIDKIDEYKDNLSEINDDINNIIKDWSKRFYILDATISYDVIAYKCNKLHLKFVTNEDMNLENFKNVGMYDEHPLYISENVVKLLNSGYDLRILDHKEIRNVREEEVKRGSIYCNTIESIWFYRGVLLMNNEHDVTDAITGIYQNDWNGTIVSSYREKHIQGEVEFIVK